MGIQLSVDWKGDLAKQGVQAGAAQGLTLAAQHVLTEANKTVPLDQGPLQRSGGTSTDSANLQAAVYYSTPYARRQHEEVGWRHKPGRRAKWLELTVQEEADRVRQLVATQIKAALQ